MWRIWVPLVFWATLTPPFILALPLVEKRLIDSVLLPRNFDLLPQTIALYAGLWLVSTFGQVAGTPLRIYFGEQLTLRLRRRLFAQCTALSLTFSHREHSGRTMGLFVNDVPSLGGIFSTTLVSWTSSLVSLVLAVVVMFNLSWQLAVVGGLAPPLVAGLASLVTRPIRPAARRAQAKAGELNERIQENLAGLREVVAFGLEHAQGLRFATTLAELLRLRMRVTYMDTALQAGQNLFTLVMEICLLGYGGYLVVRGQTTLGTLVAMRGLLHSVFYPASQLAGMFGGLQKALGAADRIYGFLDEEPDVRDRDDAHPPEGVVGAVAFQHVNFGYQMDRPVLRNISFTANPGDIVALVGPSGAGKSTLVSLIARFYDPTDGRVLLDGTDIRDLSLAGLRSQIGIVFQDTFLFATTIRENISVACTDASEASIVAAARAANAWEFIERLPKGLDTEVGERGVQLSEGQKQRVAIARALLRDPRILILDEPTSALDARSERLLQTAFENLMRGRTTFVIAHRLATVQRATDILVIDDGRILEHGSHAELMRKGGLYRELFDLQFGVVNDAELIHVT